MSQTTDSSTLHAFPLTIKETTTYPIKLPCANMSQNAYTIEGYNTQSGPLTTESITHAMLLPSESETESETESDDDGHIWNQIESKENESSHHNSSDLVDAAKRLTLNSNNMCKTVQMHQQRRNSFERLWNFIQQSLTPQSFVFLNRTNEEYVSPLYFGDNEETLPTIDMAISYDQLNPALVRQALFSECLLKALPMLKRDLHLNLRIEDDLVNLVKTCRLTETCLSFNRAEIQLYLLLLLHVLSFTRFPELSSTIESSIAPLSPYLTKLSIDEMQYRLLLGLFDYRK